MGSIKGFLGHETRFVTERYLHSLGRSDREAMDIFEKATTLESHTESHTSA